MFKLESEMIPIIRGSLPQLLNFSCIACANELPVNSRIVDIAATPVNTDHFKSTLNLTKALSKLNLLQLNLLATLIDNSPASIHRLINETYLNNNDLHDLLLDPCLKMGLIKRKSRYTYVPTEWIIALPEYIVAIEAKLERWQEALKQAQDNFIFAEYSFVALDIDKVSISQSHIENFKYNNIGLLAVSSCGSIKYTFKPQDLYATGRDMTFQKIRVLRDLVLRGRGKWKIVH